MGEPCLLEVSACGDGLVGRPRWTWTVDCRVLTRGPPLLLLACTLRCVRLAWYARFAFSAPALLPVTAVSNTDVFKGAALFVLYTLALVAWFTTFQVLKNGALSGLSVLDENRTNSAIATLAN